MIWETKRIEVPSGATLTPIAHTRMDEMSADGWQLVAAVGAAATHYLYYQREVSDANSLDPSLAGQIRRVPAKKGKADV